MVISSVALLMAILLPVLGRVRKQARAVVCQATLKQWGTTLALFIEDREGRIVREFLYLENTLWILTSGPLWVESGGDIPRRSGPSHGIRTKGMLCPMATKPANPSRDVSGSGGGDIQYEFTGGDTFRAWVLTEIKPEPRVTYGSYGLNGWLFQRRVDPAEFLGGPPQASPCIDIFSMRGTSNVPLLLDCRSHCGLPTDDTHPPQTEDSRQSSNMSSFCINRHEGHVNCLFLDWSVRKVGLKELWTFKWSKEFDTANPYTRAGGVQPNDWPQWMRRFKDY